MAAESEFALSWYHGATNSPVNPRATGMGQSALSKSESEKHRMENKDLEISKRGQKTISSGVFAVKKNPPIERSHFYHSLCRHRLK